MSRLLRLLLPWRALRRAEARIAALEDRRSPLRRLNFELAVANIALREENRQLRAAAELRDWLLPDRSQDGRS